MVKRALKYIWQSLLLILCLGGSLFGCSYIRYVAVWSPKQEIVFNSGDLRLSGTLYKPKGEGPFPAVVILHGSGPLTRAGMSGIAYKMHANAYVKKGFVTLIYDKRGSGKSDGNFRYLDYTGFIDDANAALNYLKNLPEVDSTRLGIATNSESGLFAPQIAKERGDIRFIYHRVGPTVSFREIASYQQAIRLKQNGVSPNDVQEIIKLMNETFDFTIKSAELGESYFNENKGVVQAKINEMVAKFGAAQLPFSSRIGNYNAQTINRAAYAYNYDPQRFIKDCNASMYFVYGAKDQFVPTDKCLKTIDKLKTANSNRFAYKVYPRDGHSLNRFPYIFFHGYYPPGYFNDMTSWSLDQVKN